MVHGGLAQPYSNTARDAPPVAVSRVAAANSPWHVHRSQRNRSVPVTSFPCRPTCTATTALDTRTLLPQVAISAVPFSGHPVLAISSSKLWSRSASVINLSSSVTWSCPSKSIFSSPEPERGNPSLVLAALKQTFAHRLLRETRANSGTQAN